MTVHHDEQVTQTELISTFISGPLSPVEGNPSDETGGKNCRKIWSTLPTRTGFAGRESLAKSACRTTDRLQFAELSATREPCFRTQSVFGTSGVQNLLVFFRNSVTWRSEKLTAFPVRQLLPVQPSRHCQAQCGGGWSESFVNLFRL